MLIDVFGMFYYGHLQHEELMVDGQGGDEPPWGGPLAQGQPPDCGLLVVLCLVYLP